MAPTLYHYLPVAMVDTSKGDWGERLWRRRVPLLPVALLLLLAMLILGVPLGYFAAKANSESCKDGLGAEAKCRNVTHLLERQLVQAQEGFLEAEARAATCNHTVAALEAERDQALKQTKELEGEISTLTLKLQDASAEVDRLKKENEGLRSGAQHGPAAGSTALLGLGLSWPVRFQLRFRGSLQPVSSEPALGTARFWGGAGGRAEGSPVQPWGGGGRRAVAAFPQGSVPIKCSRPSGAGAADGGMAGPEPGPGPGPEPGRAWRVLALCGAAVFLAAAAAGGALVAWNLAASAARGPRCPEPGTNATAPPPTGPPPEVEDLRRQLAEAAGREAALAGRLHQAAGVRLKLEKALKACEGRQNRLQTQLTTLKMEMEEAKAQGTQMGAENGALTEALARWEAAATESARRLDQAQQRAGAAEDERDACAGREAALRERVSALEAETGPQRRGPRPRPRSGSRPRPSARSRSRPGPSGGCRRPARRARG
ncbi:uncharacterized protein LOC142870473 [Microcebus murinus]|uniref:uncharacterized protein LOC142870473 n=1 Tax=Microcebus murinus TaxID=30608 RepID=UPI003F6A630F